MTHPTHTLGPRFARHPLAACIGCVALASVAVIPGCHISRPATESRGTVVTPPPAPPPESAWPARDLDAVRGFHERTPEVIKNWERSGTRPEAEIDPKLLKAVAEVDRTITHNALTEHGLLRVWTTEEENLFDLWFGDRFGSNGAFLTSRDASGYRLERELREIPERLGEPRGEDAPGAPGLQLTFAARSVLLDRGLDLHMPAEPGERGLLVVLGGLFSTEWQERVIDRLSDLGWAVLQIDPVTSIRPPNDEALQRASDERSAWFREQLKTRLNEEHAANAEADARPSLADMNALYNQARERFPPPPNAFALTPETDPIELGATIARAVDDAIAENAYAVSGSVAHLRDRDGLDAHRPIVLMGFSAGSLAMPAVAARLRADGMEPDAMILIGAGADLFDIAQRSVFAKNMIRITPEGEPAPPKGRVKALHAAYLASTRLDPYAVAPSLRDLPTLLILATKDQAVPNADLLDERLGYPDRITYRGGHGGLFYFLPGKVTSITRWLDRVAPRETPAD